MTDLEEAAARLTGMTLAPTPPISTVLANRTRRRRRRRASGVGALAVVVALVVVGLVAGRSSHPSAQGVTSDGGATTATNALAQGTWATLPAGPVDQRAEAAATWTGQGLFVWGGRTSTKGMAADGAMYDPTTRSWTMLPPSPLSGREGATAVWTGSQVIVWGGGTPPAPLGTGVNDSDGAIYDPATHRWSLLPPGPITNAVTGAVWAGTKLVVAGNDLSAEHHHLSAVYRPSTNQWTSIPAPAGLSEYYSWSPSVSIGETAFAVAAFTGSCACAFSAQLWALSTEDRWVAVPQPPVPFVEGPQVAVSDTTLMIVGEAGITARTSTTQLYDPTTMHWTKLTRPDPAEARTAGHNPGPGPASWTGTAYLSFYTATNNGNPPERLLGAALDPSTHQWVTLPPAPTVGGPDNPFTAQDDGPTAVWTGQQELIWWPTHTNAGLVFTPR